VVTGQYDRDWLQKRGQFWGYNDVFGGKKKVIGIACGQSQETLHRRAGDLIPCPCLAFGTVIHRYQKETKALDPIQRSGAGKDYIS